MRSFIGTIPFAVFLGCFPACFAIGILSTGHAHAQTSPWPAALNDASQDRAATVFDALPEADRKAIQDGLIWTGDYQGTVDGRFGKGTRKAIIAFATRSKLPGDGTLDAKGRARLAALAAQAKRAMRFSITTDARNGTKIGVPLRLLSKSAATKTGTRYFSADRSAALETEMTPESAGNLAQKFDAARLESRNRKVTYKILRPDFYVVTGESAGHQFYSRAARGLRNGVSVVMGFTFTYPASAKATYERLVIAAADSFEPFPGQTPSAAPLPVVMANGIVVGDGLVLASLPASGCPTPKIRGQIAKISKQDGDLALLEATNISVTPVALRMQPPAAPADVVVMSFIAKQARQGATAAQPMSEPSSELVATSGTLLTHVSAPGLRILAAPQGAIAGSPVFDRTGALIGLLQDSKAPAKQIGDIVPAVSRSLMVSARLAAFLGPNKPKEAGAGADHSLGDIVTTNRTALVPIFCGP